MSEDTQQLKREPPLERESFTDNWFIGPLHFYDVLALFLVAFFAVGLFVVGPPLFLDDFYHMGVAQEVYLLGYVPTWDFWEYLPIGRPNLYPPLLHVVMALLMKFSGGDVFFAARAVKVITYPLLILCFWYSARGLAGKKSAFYSTMALVSISSMLSLSYMIMPASLVLALTCLLFLTFTRKKLIVSIILMAVMLWLHIAMPILTIIALFAFSLVRRKEGYLEFFLKVFGVSVLLYSPWLVHVVAHIGWLSFAEMPAGLFIPLIVWALGLPALALSFRYYQNDHFIYTLYAFSLIPMFFGYGSRFWVYIVIPLSFFVGVTISRHVGSRNGKWRAVKVILVLLLAISAFLVTLSIGQGMLAPQGGGLQGGGLQGGGLPRGGPQGGAPGQSLIPSFSQPPFYQLLFWPSSSRSMITLDLIPLYLASGWIRANTLPFQPICYIGMSFSDAAAITAFTGRPTTGGMWTEVSNPLIQIVSYLYILNYGTVYVLGMGVMPIGIPGTLAADFGTIKIFVRT